DLGFGVKHLNRLKPAVDQAWHAIQESEPQDITIQEKQHGRTRNGKEFALQPAPALSLRPEKRRRQFPIVPSLQQDARLPVGILVMFLYITRERFHVVMNQR